MDLRQLEYFLAVVEHGGLHRAAAAFDEPLANLSVTEHGYQQPPAGPEHHHPH